MNAIHVGHPSPHPIPPGDSFGWHPYAGNMLLMGMEGPTARELADHKAGSRVKLALIRYERLLVLAVRFGTSPWSDSPWAPMVGHPQPDVDAWGEGSYLVFQDVLVDTSDYTTANVRMFTADAGFTRTVRRAITESLAAPDIDEQTFKGQAAAFQARWPSTSTAVKERAIATGGSTR